MEEKKTFKQKFEEFKFHMKWRMEDLKEWGKNNKDWLVFVAPVVLGSVVEITKINSRSKNTRELRKLKENYIYDRRAGHYCETRRKLKPKEWEEFDERYSMGESASSILRDMRLTKRR